MSTELKTRMTKHSIVEFWGGDARGVCVQVTGDEGYVQLTLEEAAALCEALGGFIKREAVRRQKLLRDELEALRMAERTVWHEVAELPAELFEVPCCAVDMVARLCPKTKRARA